MTSHNIIKNKEIVSEYFEQDQPQKAIKHLRKILRADPEPEIYLLLGQTYLAQKQFKKAKKTIQTGISQCSRCSQVCYLPREKRLYAEISKDLKKLLEQLSNKGDNNEKQ